MVRRPHRRGAALQPCADGGRDPDGHEHAGAVGHRGAHRAGQPHRDRQDTDVDLALVVRVDGQRRRRRLRPVPGRRARRHVSDNGRDRGRPDVRHDVHPRGRRLRPGGKPFRPVLDHRRHDGMRHRTAHRAGDSADWRQHGFGERDRDCSRTGRRRRRGRAVQARRPESRRRGRTLLRIRSHGTRRLRRTGRTLCRRSERRVREHARRRGASPSPSRTNRRRSSSSTRRSQASTSRPRCSSRPTAGC